MTPPEGFLCKQCGRCCLHLDGFSTSAYPEDVARWRAEGREDILEWVDIFYYCGQEGGYDIWISPVTGEGVPGAPGCGNILRKRNIIAASTTPSPSIAGITPSKKSRLWSTGVRGLSHKSHQKTLAEASYTPRYRAELSPGRA